MMVVASKALEVLHLEELDEQLERLTGSIVRGDAKDFAEYKHMVGQYRGLMVAKNRFEELVSKMMHDENT